MSNLVEIAPFIARRKELAEIGPQAITLSLRYTHSKCKHRDRLRRAAAGLLADPRFAPQFPCKLDIEKARARLERLDRGSREHREQVLRQFLYGYRDRYGVDPHRHHAVRTELEPLPSLFLEMRWVVAITCLITDLARRRT